MSVLSILSKVPILSVYSFCWYDVWYPVVSIILFVSIKLSFVLALYSMLSEEVKFDTSFWYVPAFWEFSSYILTTIAKSSSSV